jgi:hypothetical protein
MQNRDAKGGILLWRLNFPELQSRRLHWGGDMIGDAVEQVIQWLLESEAGPFVLVILIGAACVMFIVFLVYTAGAWLIKYSAKWSRETWRMIAIVAFIISAASFFHKGIVVAFFAGVGALVSVATVMDSLRKLAEREESKKDKTNSSAGNSGAAQTGERDK